jgi:hypothetical protein
MERWWPKAGWEYGVGYAGTHFTGAFPEGSGDVVGEIYPPVGFFGLGHLPFTLHMEQFSGKHEGRSQHHSCFLLLPAVFACEAGNPALPRYSFILWNSDSRWARVHAFDAEVCAHLIFLGARLGISPGELADFILGWFGVDIAGDDQRGAVPANEINADETSTPSATAARTTGTYSAASSWQQAR